MKTLVATSLISCCFALSGCSSLVYTTSLDTWLCEGFTVSGAKDCKSEKYKTFVGTRKNFENIKDTDWPARLLFLVDTPFSAILDVVFLIYTIPRDLIAER